MPLYDYICKDCQHETEFLLRSDETGPSQCPKCLKETFERKVCAPRFRLGGGGWYETDEKPKAKQRNIVSSDNVSSGQEKTG